MGEGWFLRSPDGGHLLRIEHWNDRTIRRHKGTRRLCLRRWEQLPDTVRHEGKRSILNFIATALAGCREDAIEHTLTVAHDVLERRAGYCHRPNRTGRCVERHLPQ